MHPEYTPTTDQKFDGVIVSLAAGQSLSRACTSAFTTLRFLTEWLSRHPNGKPLYATDDDGLPEIKTHLEVMRASLEKTEVLVTDINGLTAFAACEVDGKPRVFYRGEGAALWLWDASGAPRELAREPRK